MAELIDLPRAWWAPACIAGEGLGQGTGDRETLALPLPCDMGSPAVALYRIHQFDIDGRVVATDVVDCADDHAATQALVGVDEPGNAAGEPPHRAMEIWIGDRCVKRATDARIVRHTGPMVWPRLS